jgi:2,4-dienoyl-CoA reductase-like NADH-dependent reductase (Old Yellow Enzyme family)
MSDHTQNPLLTPYRLEDLLLKNRVVMAPLTRTRADNPRHIPNDLIIAGKQEAVANPMGAYLVTASKGRNKPKTVPLLPSF